VGRAKRVGWGALNSEQRNGWGKVHSNLAARIHGGGGNCSRNKNMYTCLWFSKISAHDEQRFRCIGCL
jgi:hypothetical protein